MMIDEIGRSKCTGMRRLTMREMALLDGASFAYDLHIVCISILVR